MKPKKLTKDQARDVVDRMVYQGFLTRDGKGQIVVDSDLIDSIIVVAEKMEKNESMIPDHIQGYGQLMDLMIVGALNLRGVQAIDLTYFVPVIRTYFPDSLELMQDEINETSKFIFGDMT